VSRQNRIPGLTIAAAGVPALITLTGHPVMGAATMGVVLLAWVAHARAASRAASFDRTELDPGRPAALIEPIDEFDPDEDERPWVYLRPSEW
jgi:hypothetical protein